MVSLTLESFEGLELETILRKLPAVDVAAVACVSTRLRSRASDESLWRYFCARDFDLNAPTGPSSQPCPSFKVGYQVWYESFRMYPFPLVRRAKKCWESIRGWLAVNFPEAMETLEKGASEDEITQAEENLGVKFPVAARILFRFCNGQATASDEHKSHLVVSRELDSSLGPNHVIVAASNFSEKLFFLNCTNGQLYVGTKNLFPMLPCVSQALLKPESDVSDGLLQDGLLLWLEEHCRRLQSGMISTRIIGKSLKMINLFPEAYPLCSTAVTNGVQVRASAVFVPEMSDPNSDEQEKYLFSYSIRMSLRPEGCILDGTYYGSCQLLSRHWIIKSDEVVLTDMRGEAVVGKFPHLFPNKEEFVYESCSPLPSNRGSIEGSFTFVPGRLRKPEGRQFEVEVARFLLEVPEFIF